MKQIFSTDFAYSKTYIFYLHTVNWAQLVYIKSSLNIFLATVRTGKSSFNSAVLQCSKFRDIFMLSALSDFL